MSTNVTITSTPTHVSIIEQIINVTISEPAINLTLANTGPQGATGPSGGISTLTGDVSANGVGSVAASITAGAITSAKMSPGAATANIGTLSGDLSGTLPNASVVKINGQTPATVATSGNYSDLLSKPSLGSASSHNVGDFLQTANNLNDVANASSVRSNLGLGSAATHSSSDFTLAANNLSDVANASSSRGNLGLGSAAIKAASDATQSGVASVKGATTSGHAAVFADATGTVKDGGNLTSSISNSDASLTISPSSGNVVASLNTSHANNFAAAQFFGGGMYASNMSGYSDNQPYFYYDDNGDLYLGDYEFRYNGNSLAIEQYSGISFIIDGCQAGFLDGNWAIQGSTYVPGTACVGSSIDDGSGAQLQITPSNGSYFLSLNGSSLDALLYDNGIGYGVFNTTGNGWVFSAISNQPASFQASGLDVALQSIATGSGGGSLNFGYRGSGTHHGFFQAVNSSGSLTAVDIGDGLGSYSDLYANNLVALAGIKPNLGLTTLNGSTSGTLKYSMPISGTACKIFIVTASSYENNTATNQTITFPVAFLNTPIILANNTGLTLSATTTTLTVTSPHNTTVYSGTVIIMGT